MHQLFISLKRTLPFPTQAASASSSSFYSPSCFTTAAATSSSSFHGNKSGEGREREKKQEKVLFPLFSPPPFHPCFPSSSSSFYWEIECCVCIRNWEEGEKERREKWSLTPSAYNTHALLSSPFFPFFSPSYIFFLRVGRRVSLPHFLKA